MKTEEFKTVELVTMPDYADMKDGELYLSRTFQLAIHLCACGCREQTVTPIDDGTHGWTFTHGETGGVTLHPSIGNQNMSCKSHYWVQDGKIVWC